MKVYIQFIFFCLACIVYQPVFSQPGSYDIQKDSKLFKQGQELYLQKNYAAAREILDEYLLKSKDNAEKIIEAEYLRAMSAMYLQNKDAEILLENFVKQHPEKSASKQMYFQLANHQYANRSYGDAARSFKKVNPKLLKAKDLETYHFKYGYCCYRTRKIEEAKSLFSPLLNEHSFFGKQATYYYSHIAYEEEDYETALKGFNELKNDKKYRNLVSYYIVQIYYHQNKPEQLLEVALPLMSSIHRDRKPELSQLIGQAYYQLSEYDKAIKYLEEYQETTKKRVPREKQYELAFTYFQTGDYEKALEKFKSSVAGLRDSLAQSAYYHLGMCYLETEQPTYAANSFYSAYQIDNNDELREDALYNYVKLSYENPNNTYNKSADAVKNYLNEFPYSKHKDEINEFLVDIFLTSKDYQSAIRAFDEIKNKTPRLEKAYQQITFYRGVDLYNEKDYADAISLFDESLSYNYDKNMAAQSLFWMADAYYQKKNYNKAYITFKKFLKAKGAYNLPIYPTAYYNLGYILFSQKKYLEAKTYFEKYTIGTKDRKQNMLADSYLRLGDIYFIGQQYDKAISYYQKAIGNNVQDMDYATYQQALAYGGKGNFSTKINTLENLLSQFNQSPFRDDAEFEIGMTYTIQERAKKAIEHFDNVINNYPNSPKVKQAYLKAGLLYFNMDQSSKSIALLKKVVEKYPESAEAREALAGIKNIYIDMNNADEYFKYANNVKYASVSSNEKDSVLYITAENLYMKGDCNKSKQAFDRYLDENPKGVFVINAHFYIAECDFRNEEKEAALSHYEKVIQQPGSEFFETALSKAAKITYELKNNNKALDYFSQLEKISEYEDNKSLAYEGLMRTNYNLKKYNDAISSAQKLMKQANVSEDRKMEANLIVGRSAMELNKKAIAKDAFSAIAQSKRKNMAAEANYNLALLSFLEKKYSEAENKIFSISEKYASEDEWLAKSFVLLSDVYVKTGDLFQAKQTLQSIIDNYKGADLVEIAKEKKAEIEKTEKKAEKEKIEKENKAKESEKDIENY